MINPAVADVAEIHPARREPAQAHGGLHAVAFLVAAAEINQRAVDLRENSVSTSAKPAFMPLADC